LVYKPSSYLLCRCQGKKNQETQSLPDTHPGVLITAGEKENTDIRVPWSSAWDLQAQQFPAIDARTMGVMNGMKGKGR
jgi:hypothetical protein